MAAGRSARGGRELFVTTGKGVKSQPLRRNECCMKGGRTKNAFVSLCDAHMLF